MSEWVQAYSENEIMACNSMPLPAAGTFAGSGILIPV